MLPIFVIFGSRKDTYMTKICGRCKIEKPLSEYHKNPVKNDGVQSMCKKCRKEYHRQHYLANKEKYAQQVNKRKKELREWFQEYKKVLECKNCGEKRWYILDFHHREPEEKDFTVAQLVHEGRSKESILYEVEKCDVLCRNCHGELHYLERNAPLV